MDETPKSRFSKILRGIYVAIRNYFAIVGLLATVAPLVLLWIIHSKGQEITKIAPEGLTGDRPLDLYLRLNGPLAEKTPDFTELIMTEFFDATRSLYLPEIRSALRHAQEDELVEGLALELGLVEGTLAEFAELRRILVDFRDAGKRVRVTLNNGYNWMYYIASAANYITLNPAGGLMIPGPMFHLTYFGDAMRKLGVDVEVLRAGKYKSALEPFVRNSPSGAALEQYQAMETALRDHVIEAVAKARNQDPKDVERWYKQAIFTPDVALSEGLVDAIGYPDSTPDKIAGDRNLRLSEYARVAAQHNEAAVVDDAGSLGLIEAVGEIMMSGSDGVSETTITPFKMRRKLDWARKDEDVKAVVIRISSPGGSAVASDMIWNDVANLANDKPVVVSMGAYAASGGYYIAAPATKIVAEPTTITGSIGVFGALPNFEAFEEKYGVSFHVVSQTERQSLFHPGKKSDAFDKTLMEGGIQSTYKTFLDRVARGRSMTIEDVDAISQGRVYTGIEAVKINLVDKVGGLQTAFNLAKELAGFDAEKLYPVARYKPERFSLRECLSSPMKLAECLDVGGAFLSPYGFSVATFVPKTTKSALARLARLLKTGETMALWPGYLSLSRQKPDFGGRSAISAGF